MRPALTTSLLNVGGVSAALLLLSLLVLPSFLSLQGLPFSRAVTDSAAAAAGAAAQRAERPGQAGVDGRARAFSWRTCNMTYKTTPKQPVYILSERLKLTYILMSKSGSSTVRQAMQSEEKMGQQPNWNYTVFTIVRDPLERIVSYFFEGRGEENREKSPEQVLQLFDQATALLVHRKGGGGHAHGQRSVPIKHPYDFVGSLATFDADWAQLGELQKQRFGIADWPPAPFRQRDRRQSYRKVLDASTLPGYISQRICNTYRDDYCCFQLHVPRACRVDCASGRPVDPPYQRPGPP